MNNEPPLSSIIKGGNDAIIDMSDKTLGKLEKHLQQNDKYILRECNSLMEGLLKIDNELEFLSSTLSTMDALQEKLEEEDEEEEVNEEFANEMPSEVD